MEESKTRKDRLEHRTQLAIKGHATEQDNIELEKLKCICGKPGAHAEAHGGQALQVLGRRLHLQRRQVSEGCTLLSAEKACKLV